MSASQDKKRRQAERAAGESPKTLAEREAAKKARKERRSWTIVGIILAVFVILVLLLNSNLLYTGATAVTIGDYEYTNAEFQYYYNTAVNNFLSAFGNYAVLGGLDTSKPLGDQVMSESAYTMFQLEEPESLADVEEYTWEDYFRAVTLENMVQVTALWDAAVKAGYTLSEEDAETIEEMMNNYEYLGNTNNLRGADGYLAMAYGKGVDSELVRALLERAYVAEDYSNDIFYGFEYSREELDSYYDEHADAFDSFSLEYYFVAAEKEEVTETVTDEETGEETEETNEEVTEATMADAKELADQIQTAAEFGAEQQAMNFTEAVAEVIGGDAEAVEVKGMLGISVSHSFPTAMGEWLIDSARADGDISVFESPNNGYYVVLFHGRSDSSDYNAVAFRHILLNVDDADEDGELSEEEIEETEDKIDELLNTWLEEGGDEDSFADLANSNSEDSGSNGTSVTSSSGGLYEHVARDQMVPEINDWLFASGRKSGDYDTIFVESDNYTGWHLVYFVGEDDITYHDCLAELGITNTSYDDAPEGLRRPDYEAWETELESGFALSVNSFVNWFAKI